MRAQTQSRLEMGVQIAPLVRELGLKLLAGRKKICKACKMGLENKLPFISSVAQSQLKDSRE